MTATYYSPDAILTDAQKAPCKFELDVPRLVALNNGTGIEIGTKLDLPLWMAELLAVSRPGGPSSNPLTTLDMPIALGSRVMNALRADPKSVELRAQAQWFYGLAEHMLYLFDEEEKVEVLTETFKKRAHEIADKAQKTRNTGGLPGDPFMTGLDENERQLFSAAHGSTGAVKKWFEVTSRT